MRLVMFALLCLLISGCVYLDMTMLDTAEPQSLWKPSAQMYMSRGIDVDTAIFIPGIDFDNQSETESNRKAEGGDINGIKGAIGLGNDFELGLKTWQGEGRGYKLNVKKRFYNHNNLSVAVSPAFYQLTKESEEKYLYGWEVPLLLTYKPGKVFAGTLQIHFNQDTYWREYDNGTGMETYGPYRLPHGGAIAGINFTFGIFNLYGEMGCEYIDAMNGPVTYLPLSACGIGVTFK